MRQLALELNLVGRQLNDIAGSVARNLSDLGAAFSATDIHEP